MSSRTDLVGKIGQVTGTIGSDTVGEVRLAYGGGTYEFFAYPAEGGAVIPIGKQVLVVDYDPERRAVTVIEDDLLTNLSGDVSPPA